MRDALVARWSGLTALLGRQLARHIVWIRHDRTDLFGAENTRYALVAIVGRQWYRERRKSYPVRSVSELRRILRLELNGKDATLFHIGPLVDDKRQVTLFELSVDLPLENAHAAFIVPESHLAGRSLNTGEIAVVRSAEGAAYFVTADGTSQQQGGALQSAELFAMALGLSPPEAVVELSAEDVRSRLQSALAKLEPTSWFDALNPAFVQTIWRVAQPLSIALATLGLTYLLIVSGYLTGMTAYRDYQIEQLGPEVDALLEKQRRLESLGTKYQGLAELTDQSLATYKIWGLITNVWQSGGSVSAVSIADGVGSLRGTAPVATEVLRQLGSEPAIRNPSFDAPVRQSGGAEEFVIKFTLAESGKAP